MMPSRQVAAAERGAALPCSRAEEQRLENASRVAGCGLGRKVGEERLDEEEEPRRLALRSMENSSRKQWRRGSPKVAAVIRNILGLDTCCERQRRGTAGKFVRS